MLRVCFVIRFVKEIAAFRFINCAAVSFDMYLMHFSLTQ